ncbi:trypsin-like serine protease [Rhizobium ruizarguesonis]
MFKTSNPNTCKGDSGGPSFLQVDDAFVLIGVTSRGDLGCTQGTNLRVDSYLPWLESRIR